MSEAPPPELPGGQDEDPPDLHLLLVVLLALIIRHLHGDPIPRRRWEAIRAVLERALNDDSS